MNKQKIPRTDSIQVLAEFWDKNDITDFENQLEEIPEQIFECKSVMEVHLQSEEMEAVKKYAKTKGISPMELVREWVLEKLPIT